MKDDPWAHSWSGYCLASGSNPNSKIVPPGRRFVANRPMNRRAIVARDLLTSSGEKRVYDVPAYPHDAYFGRTKERNAKFDRGKSQRPRINRNILLLQNPCISIPFSNIKDSTFSRERKHHTLATIEVQSVMTEASAHIGVEAFSITRGCSCLTPINQHQESDKYDRL